MINKEEINLLDKDFIASLEQMNELKGAVVPFKDRIIGTYIPILQRTKIKLDLDIQTKQVNMEGYDTHPGVFIIFVSCADYQNQNGVMVIHEFEPGDIVYIKVPRPKYDLKGNPVPTVIPGEPFIFNGVVFDVIREYDILAIMSENEKKKIEEIINLKKYELL